MPLPPNYKKELYAVDTNIVVRLLTRDHEEQYQIAANIFEQESIWLIDTVMLETEWVLRKLYHFEKTKIIQALRYLLGLSNVIVENVLVLNNALTWSEQGLDFADALHLAKSYPAHRFLTFDEKFAKKSSLTVSEVKVELATGLSSPLSPELKPASDS
jgi:predicted nucleic-acid-binding protein